MTPVYIYTAVLANYDELPSVAMVDDEIQYVCFTDSAEDLNAAHPWQIISIGSYFKDPKITIGFLKANSHLLFGFDSISLWVDANLRDLKVCAKQIIEMLVSNPIAASPHFIRTRVLDEAMVVKELGLEHPSVVERHVRMLASRGFPDDHGLSANGMLARDHKDSRVRRSNDRWWEIISGGVRRDQLSFMFAVWESGLKWTRLDIDWRIPNSAYTLVPHKNPLNRNLPSDHVATAVNGSLLDLPKSLPSNYPHEVCYWHESLLPEELQIIRDINSSLIHNAPNEEVEENYCYFQTANLTGLTPMDPRRSWKREYLRRAIKGCRAGLEIGFNAGHSASIMLTSEPFFQLISVDICSHKYTEPCSELVSQNFGQRFCFYKGKSAEILPRIDAELLDFVHIDGGRDEASVTFDINWFCKSARDGCLLLINNAYEELIQHTYEAKISDNILSPICPGLPSSGENILLIKRPRY